MQPIEFESTSISTNSTSSINTSKPDTKSSLITRLIHYYKSAAEQFNATKEHQNNPLLQKHDWAIHYIQNTICCNDLKQMVRIAKAYQLQICISIVIYKNIRIQLAN